MLLKERELKKEKLVFFKNSKHLCIPFFPNFIFGLIVMINLIHVMYVQTDLEAKRR